MSGGLIFVTATHVDVKIINRLLLHLRDWEFGEDGSWDAFSIVTSKDITTELSHRRNSSFSGETTGTNDDEAEEEEEEEENTSGHPPLTNFQNPEWSGCTVEDVEKAMIKAYTEIHGEKKQPKSRKTTKAQKATENAKNYNLTSFLILDDRSVRDETIVVAHRPYNSRSKEGYEKIFEKTRMPWADTYIMWCNLDIANMDFESFVDEENGPDEEGKHWWTAAPISPYPGNPEGDELVGEEQRVIKKRRGAAIKELKRLDLAS